MHREPVRHATLFAVLVAALSAVLGGCPDFRNSVVDAVESATTTVLLDAGDPQDATATAARGVASAALTLFFDQLRTDQTTF